MRNTLGRRHEGVLALAVWTWGALAAPAPALEDRPAQQGAGVVPLVRDDKRRTVRSYGTNLLHNVVGVLSSDNRGPFFVTAAFTAPAFAWDDEVMRYFTEHPQKRYGEIGQNVGGALAVGGITVGFFAAGRVARGDRFRAATYDASQAIIVTQLYTQGLKLAVRRERPDDSNRRSFPSGHASNAFAIASVVGHHYGPWAEVPMYAIATFVATSRLAANKHHFSDIVAGAGLGWGMGRAVARRNGRPPSAATKAPARVGIAFTPDAGPAGDGRGLSVKIRF